MARTGGSTGTNSITWKAFRRLQSVAGRHVMMKKGGLRRINRLLTVVNYSPIIAIVAAVHCCVIADVLYITSRLH